MLADHMHNMGRGDYLARLALGRSPFQEPASTEDHEDETGHQRATAITEPSTSNHVQRFDAKGRPINAATEAYNAEMRRAQNSVLELVGVVERRELAEQHDEMKFRYIREARHSVLASENETGEGLETIVQIAVAPLATWWADCLVERCLVGMYAAEEPFSKVLGGMWQMLTSGGLKGAYALLLPGSAACLVQLVVELCLEGVTEELIRRLSERLLRQRLRSTTQKRWLSALDFLEAGLRLATELAMLPISYYSISQQAGLAPAFPLLPSFSYNLPRHPLSFHAFGWKPIARPPILRSVCSPAASLLAQMAIRAESERDAFASGDPMWNRSSTSDPPAQVLSAHRDPIGWVLSQTYRVRTSALRWCGWSLMPSSSGHGSDSRHEVDVAPADGKDTGVSFRRHRSTALSRLPSTYLAASIDQLVLRVLLLPIEWLSLRAIAVSFAASPLPKTPGFFTLLVPADSFAKPVMDAFHSASARTILAQQVSKVGLAVTLRVCIGCLLCVGITETVCWFGRRSFDWGSRTTIGGIVYSTLGRSPGRRRVV